MRTLFTFSIITLMLITGTAIAEKKLTQKGAATTHSQVSDWLLLVKNGQMLKSR